MFFIIGGSSVLLLFSIVFYSGLLISINIKHAVRKIVVENWTKGDSLISNFFLSIHPFFVIY